MLTASFEFWQIGIDFSGGSRASGEIFPIGSCVLPKNTLQNQPASSEFWQIDVISRVIWIVNGLHVVDGVMNYWRNQLVRLTFSLQSEQFITAGSNYAQFHWQHH